MDLVVEGVEVWAAPIEEGPGSLAAILGGLRDAGADLELIIARRTPEGPSAGVVFVTPLQGDREIAAATDLGFNITRSVASLRVVGPDRPGIAAELTQMLAERDIALVGLSAAVIGPSFIMHARLESLAEVERAKRILEEALEPVPAV
jgi:predicted amino acid-binding ACT domain protein